MNTRVLHVEPELHAAAPATSSHGSCNLLTAVQRRLLSLTQAHTCILFATFSACLFTMVGAGLENSGDTCFMNGALRATLRRSEVPYLTTDQDSIMVMQVTCRFIAVDTVPVQVSPCAPNRCPVLGGAIACRSTKNSALKPSR